MLADPTENAKNTDLAVIKKQLDLAEHVKKGKSCP
jgi:hypothetical protein